MELAYSPLIDWVLNEQAVSQATALAALPVACSALVMQILREGEPYKLSFGYEDADGVFRADFTPHRGHPLARKYALWAVIGDSPYDAIRHAQMLWEYRRDQPKLAEG